MEDAGIPSLFDVYSLEKQGIKIWWFVSRINVAAQTMFLKRDDPESRHRVLDEFMAMLQSGWNIALFPEGGCMGRRIYSSFQSGVFDLSIRTGIPILPVFLQYEAQETFEWHSPLRVLGKMWHFMTSRNNRANYYVYDAIYPESFTDKKEFAEAVRQQYPQWQTRFLE